MKEILIALLLLVAGFVLLIKGADFSWMEAHQLLKG